MGWAVPGSNPGGEAKFFPTVKTGPGAHPNFYIMDAGPFQGVKRPERDVDHPPHLAPRLRKEMICASTSFVACCKVNFTFTSFYYSFFLVISILLSLSFYFLTLFLVKIISFLLPSSFLLRPFHFKTCVRLSSHNLFSISVLICSAQLFIQSHQLSQVPGQYIRP